MNTVSKLWEINMGDIDFDQKFWQNNFENFIVLENKIPIHQLSQPKKFQEVVHCDNIAVLIPEPYVVLDVDNEEDSQAYVKYLKETQRKVFQMRTRRGIHFWFKSQESLPNFINKNNALGVFCDVRSYGKLSYVIIKKDGKWREILTRNFKSIDQTDYLNKFDIPIQNKLFNDIPSPSRLREGDGRRDNLFQRIIPLAKEGFTKEDVQTCLRLINVLIFQDPINENEFKNLFTDESIWEKFNANKPYWINKGGKWVWSHDQFALYLHKIYHGLKKDDRYWVFHNNRYRSEKTLLEELMIEEMGSLKQTQRNEVKNYLMVLPQKFNSQVEENPYIIGVKNGLLNVETGELKKFDSRYFIQTHLDVTYNPTVDTQEVDDILRSLANGDELVHNLLEEVMGYCLLQDQRFQKAFIVVGEGSNGKSLWLKMIADMIGHENVSAIDYTQVTEKFKIATLLGKMVNIGEEMPNRLTKQPEIFKKLITGDPVQAEFKNENTFVLRNKAKFIFSANELPPTIDRSHGFYRRWMIIPFLKKFDHSNRDLTLTQKCSEEGFKSKVLKVALKGLNRLLDQNSFTHVPVVDSLMKDYQIDNNTTLRYLREEVINISNLEDCPVTEVFRRYKEYCSMEGFLNLSSPKFIKEVLKEYPSLDIRIVKVQGLDIKVFKNKGGK